MEKLEYYKKKFEKKFVRIFNNYYTKDNDIKEFVFVEEVRKDYSNSLTCLLRLVNKKNGFYIINESQIGYIYVNKEYDIIDKNEFMTKLIKRNKDLFYNKMASFVKTNEKIRCTKEQFIENPNIIAIRQNSWSKNIIKNSVILFSNEPFTNMDDLFDDKVIRSCSTVLDNNFNSLSRIKQFKKAPYLHQYYTLIDKNELLNKMVRDNLIKRKNYIENYNKVLSINRNFL